MSAKTGLPLRCGVLGGGRMGAGIAHALLLAGSHVVVVERDGKAAAAACDRVAAMVETSARRGPDPGVVRRSEALSTATTCEAFAGCGLVIEAVPEIADLKFDALPAVESVLGANAVLASNTSSLSIDDLAGVLARPGRFLGMHFFNPVPASELVEVVTSAHTDREVVNSAVDWVAALGKASVVVRNSPGFASSRLGLALGLEAIRMVEQGVASARDIDVAMTLGYKHPVGPLRLTDMVGLDVRLDIADYLAGTLGERFAAPQLMRDMVERGELGRKSGKGFYTW
jgi:3-hydroxybutyryl-CoA dehydrogenase